MADRRTIISDIISLTLAPASGAPAIQLSDAEAYALCRLGLGSVAHHLCESGQVAATKQALDQLHGAELTTRLIYKRTLTGVAELIGRLNVAGITPTLLKGISVSGQYYDPPHARVMGDVDILVSGKDLATANDIIVALGYVLENDEKLDGDHHHLPAVRHPESGVIVELHSALFSPESTALQQTVFHNDEWRHFLVPSNFEHHSVDRFTPEYQFAYTIAHWAAERKWPENIFSILDAVLIANRSDSFDWPLLARWMKDGQWFGICTTIMLTYLEQSNLIRLSRCIRDSMAVIEQDFGTTNLRLMLWLMHTVPMSGRDRSTTLIGNREARIAWRSMLTPGKGFATPSTAILLILRTSLGRIQLYLYQLIRQPAKAIVSMFQANRNSGGPG